jgi:hypothetical protein
MKNERSQTDLSPDESDEGGSKHDMKLEKNPQIIRERVIFLTQARFLLQKYGQENNFKEIF